MKSAYAKLCGVAVLAFGGYFFTAVANAACGPQPHLQHTYRSIAEEHFSQLLPSLPALMGCDSAADFPFGVLGDFSPDDWRIRVLLNANSMPIEITLAHELGHALAHKNGETYGRFKGHGKVWIQTMIRAGYAAEAERTANLHEHYPGMLAVYQSIARGESASRRRAPEIDVIALLRSKPSWLASLTAPID